MDEINYEALKITETEANKVKIANSADRPNAFNSYRLSKMDSTDVKKMFDKPFELAMKKHNALVDQMEANDKAVAERLDEQDERIASAEGVVDQLRKEADSGAFKGDAYILTEEDKAEIAAKAKEDAIGDIETALDRIIAIQKELMGTDTDTITFTIVGAYDSSINFTLDAKKGMTWGEWIDSEYNTIGAYPSSSDADNGSVYFPFEGSQFVAAYDNVDIWEDIWDNAKTTEVIISGYAYQAVGY